MRGVDPGDDGVLWLLVPPGCVAGLGAETFLLRAGVLLDNCEWLGAKEAEGGRGSGHRLQRQKATGSLKRKILTNALPPSAWALVDVTG